MAETVVVGSQTFKKRNIFAVWLGLPIITLGIYHYVWWYKINNEARRFLNDESIKPGVSVLAILFGWILIFIPFFISIYRTGERIRRMEKAAGISDATVPWIGLALYFAFGLHALYYQLHLNGIWDRYLAAGGVAVQPPAQSPPLPPPASA